MADTMAGEATRAHGAADVAGQGTRTIPYGHDSRVSAVSRVAVTMIEHLDALAVRSASEIWNREAEFRETLAGPEDLFGPCRTTMGSALRSLVAGRLEENEVSELRAVGKAASQQGLPLEVVLRGLRVDFLVLWSEMLLVARTTDPTTQQSLINASEIVWGAVDAVTAQFTIGYRSNNEARLRAESARREELLLRVLAGESAAPMEVTNVLGLTSADEVVVVVCDGTGAVGVEDLSRCMRYASMHACWAHVDDLLVGTVATRARKPGMVIESLRQIAGLRAGVAQPRLGLVELPAALQEATLALVAMKPGTSGVATVFDDPIAVLMASRPELAGSLLRDALGPVLARPERERDMLIETLVAFDDLDGSVPLVAERLFCHRNTVLNRLGKITRLTGLSFTSPNGLAIIALAARAARAGLLHRPDQTVGDSPIVHVHSSPTQRRWTGTAPDSERVIIFTDEVSDSDADA